MHLDVLIFAFLFGNCDQHIHVNVTDSIILDTNEGIIHF